MNPQIDSYSAFFENDKTTPTGLTGYLQTLHIKRVFCVGLAYDYCVRYSAEDANTANFETVVIKDACRAIDMNNSASDTTEAFKSKGISLVDSDAIT